MKKYLLITLTLILFSCSQNENSNEINIYSQRHYNVDELQYENFQKKTGIKVNVVKVNIVNKKSRNKITRGRKIKIIGYKKAIVTLKKGQNIDLTTGI